MKRREFLGAAALSLGLAAAPGSARAFGNKNRLVLARLMYRGGDPGSRPSALRRLAAELIHRTSVDPAGDYLDAAPDSPRLFQSALAFATGSMDIQPFNDEEIRNLRRWLGGGGLLVVDGAADVFVGAMKREMARVLPDIPITELKREHVLYKTFYLISTQPGRTLRKPWMECMEADGRLAVLFSHNDMTGAWERDEFGVWRYDVNPGGQAQREMAFRMGVNVVMYTTCLHYKDDQVHLPFILRRRR